jgi:hypothetical protein
MKTTSVERDDAIAFADVVATEPAVSARKFIQAIGKTPVAGTAYSC